MFDGAHDDLIVYLAQTAELGVTYRTSAPDAAVLVAYSDSDWAVGHSTTGWACTLAGAAIGYSSKRQPCIACSSTEAEIIAASACALEVVYFRGLLREMVWRMQIDQRLDSRPFVLPSVGSLGEQKSGHAPSRELGACQRRRSV